ncbi:MAG: FAD-binding oxidoreductase [archaeon]|nr:FAD-binding oxidoreductase [archaeon]
MLVSKIGPDSAYVSDESKVKGYADTLYIPENEAEVIEAVLGSKGPITISGMRTGMCGGSVPYGGNVISMERFDSFIGIGHDDRGFFVRVQPFVTVRQLNDLLRRKAYLDLPELTEGALELLRSEGKEYFYPVDPTELNGSLGGNIVSNASGPRTYRYGPTRNWVRRVRTVLPDGSVLDIKRGDLKAEGRVLRLPMKDGLKEIKLPSYTYNTSVKNTTGMFVEDDMDAVDLFVGSEGMFGILTEADLYIVESHPLISNIVFLPGDMDAYALSRDFPESGVVPEFLEFFDSGSLDLIRAVREEDPRYTDMPDIPKDAGSALFFDLPYDDALVDSYNRLKPVIERHGGSLEHSWCGHDLRDRQRFFSMRHSVPETIFRYVAKLQGTSSPGIHTLSLHDPPPSSCSSSRSSPL